jgi:hypothetical protein
MTVTVEAISGPDDATFIYLRGTHTDPAFVRINTIKRSVVAADPSRVAVERDLLVSQVEQAYSDYMASQAALEGL